MSVTITNQYISHNISHFINHQLHPSLHPSPHQVPGRWVIDLGPRRAHLGQLVALSVHRGALEALRRRGRHVVRVRALVEVEDSVLRWVMVVNGFLI